MEGIRRTIPRSARRTPARQDVSQFPATPRTPASQKTIFSPERYAPAFRSSQNEPAKIEPQALPPIRTGVEALSPSPSVPTLAYAPAPLTTVRWLPAPGRDAIAAVGTGDGAPDADFLSLYRVSTRGGDVSATVARDIDHPGKVLRIASSLSSETLFVGSSDGSIRTLSLDSWETSSLETLSVMPRRAARPELVTGVAPVVNGRVAALGGDGTFIVVDVSRCQEIGRAEMADPVGFFDGTAVDAEAGNEVVSAGAGCEVCVWDTRIIQTGRGNVQTLGHPTPGVATRCVTTDPAQPHFVIGGTRNGELCTWDRRGTEPFPLNRVAMHDGVVWETRVVSSSKPGLLLSCGEDSKVWLMDFAAAASRDSAMGSESGEFWRSMITQSDVRNVVGWDSALGINGIDAHPTADLYAYASDSGAVAFGCLYS
ncbi:unnamed protein product [Chondrus crispus]|uniref:Uncharacterized protein n=1 Tax=Chondrus crispus TaxID=2769 RepID=R7QKX8_CHOCR|nr:unnamed protein product [Chondrus crispus]CDF38136.1 unnamed protein product [Chondrus crispus]|eukprot:XP_005718005.1 unnamed protein product [Chondrus crispus]